MECATNRSRIITVLLILITIILAPVAAIAAYNRIEGVNLIGDALYEYRLRRIPLEEADAACRSNPQVAEIIVCLTTTPTRIEHIDTTLKSLLLQRVRPQQIRLHIPHFSTREQLPYNVPERLRHLSCLTIVRCDDRGPATKLLPALVGLPPEQALLVVDDDRIYHPHVVATVADHARQQPDIAFGFSGWRVPHDLTDRPTTLLSDLLSRPPVPLKCSRIRHPQPIDVMQGFSGYVIRPSFFNLAAVTDYTQAPAAAFFVDDVWFSAHCQVAKYVIPSPPSNFLSYVDGRHFKASSLGVLNRGGGDNEKRNNTIMLRYFSDRWLGSTRTTSPSNP